MTIEDLDGTNMGEYIKWLETALEEFARIDHQIDLSEDGCYLSEGYKDKCGVGIDHIRDWYDTRQNKKKIDLDNVRQRAIEKLTPEEREAIGVQ